MKWPSGVQWEWAIGEFAVLGFLCWELFKVRRSIRRDREKARQDAAAPAMARTSVPRTDPT